MNALDPQHTTPRVTVILTAYNVRPYVAQAIESVLQQTDQDYELIVVDDGSTDGSAEEIETFRTPRLRVVHQAHTGSSGAKNTGIALARGEYLAFLDGDDYWDPAKLARHVVFHDSHPAVDLTFSLSVSVDSSGTVLGLMNARRSGYVSFTELLLDNHIRCGSSVMVRAEALCKVGCFDGNLQACIDYDAWLRVAQLRAANTYCIAEPFTFYRRREGQISSNWRRMQQGHTEMMRKLQSLSSDWRPSHARISQSNMHRYYAYLAYERGSPGMAARLLLTSFGLAPVHCLVEPRSWMMMAAIASRCVLSERVHARLERCAFALRSRYLMRATH
jgi:glycosyltransferase involved in cell wall biosynthesis